MSPTQKVPLIVKLISDDYEVGDLVHVPKSRKTNPINEPRYIAMLLIRRHTSYTFDWIGRHMKEYNAQQRVAYIENRIAMDPELKRRVDQIETRYIEYITYNREYEPTTPAE